MWMVGSVDVIKECIQYSEHCLAKRKPQQLYDVGFLAMNSIYVFTKKISPSIARHFNCLDRYHDIIESLKLYYASLSPTSVVFSWCLQAERHSYNGWKSIIKATVDYLTEAIESDNCVLRYKLSNRHTLVKANSL
ncbi:hypothetical protein BDC45DRAFT_183243 [Circinella umbellata]|nr:hypothetical protein BDC45DRAFT_183243 [Circinella umbellata]